MMKSNKTTLILLLALIFAAGFLASKSLYQNSKKETSTEEALILIEQIKAVSKLIAVEAYFNELYTYKDYKKFNWVPFKKKAIIRVRAKISAGYDLSNLKFETNAESKSIYMNPLPEPVLLSMDHELDYYDIQEGVFNSFKVEDYNKMNGKAKELILDQAKKSSIMKEASLKAKSLIENLQSMAEQNGWKLIIR